MYYKPGLKHYYYYFHMCSNKYYSLLQKKKRFVKICKMKEIHKMNLKWY